MSLVRRLGTAAVVAAVALVGSAAVPGAVAPATAAEEVYPVPASGSWTVDGRGWGHGRGMSQWGTQGAALQGVSARQMLEFYYPGTTAGTAADRTLTIGLTAWSPTLSATFWGPTGDNAVIQSLSDPSQRFQQAAGRKYTVTVSGSTVTVARRSPTGATETPLTLTGPVRISTPGGVGVAGSPTSTSATWYRGSLVVVPTGAADGRGFDVRNEVELEQYLRGVVPHESPASWHSAALQAQSVAARTYALYKIARKGTSPIDICDTVSCQVYRGRGTLAASGSGTTTEHARTDAAIAATAGQVRLWNGQVALTEFSSSNGGWTVASDVPYQTAKADPWTGTAPGDSVTSWTATLTVAEVQKQCPSNGRLQRLVVLGRDGNGPLGGRITRVRMDCTTGSSTLSTPRFDLRSSWWKPRAAPAAPTLTNTAQSTTSMPHGGQVTVAATPTVDVDWTLTVRDTRTRTVVNRYTGSTAGGDRIGRTWFGTSAAGPLVGAGAYELELSARTPGGQVLAPYRGQVQVGPAPDPAPVAAVPLVGNGGYVAVTPTRLVDTRTTFDSIGPRQRVDLPVAGRAGVPANATAVVLNVTAVHASNLTHLRAWPAGQTMPDISVLNTGPGLTQAGLVTVGVGGQGRISLYNADGDLHYVVDVLGHYTADLTSSARYTSLDAPRRVLSTMSGPRLPGGSTRVVDVAAQLGVPAASVGAVMANVTVAGPLGEGNVVAHGGGAHPGTSTVNMQRGADVANRAVVPVQDGKITVATEGAAAHVVVDVVGWFGRAGVTTGSTFTPVVPTRLLDTRASGAPFGALGAGQTRQLAVTGGVVPADARAVLGTLTATGQTSPRTHAKIWPGGVPSTEASDLNSGANRTQANTVVVRPGTGPRAGGWVQLYNDQGSSHLILDVTGYFR